MKRPKRTTTMLSTAKIAVILAVNIQVQTGQAYHFFPVPLVVMTGLFFRLWNVFQIISRYEWKFYNFMTAILDLLAAFGMAARVFWNVGDIAARSVWYGVAS
ncbi:MAG: hypothetical protein JXM69_15320 [Anaerolineae bacterium]|nr:hypothetical protein [Anaerolineae bacterium]